ncbi:hypothetical protein MAMT_02110 [Methylacidimicrobium tartarophylax]|uniref:Uncharacterized protein n=1 Tax=Methylacidimicrobium tartarophylax TaxID=1041768 RepID=A0A5E6MIF0_9BACT|nr:hypothetical protein [Methylacidimicrobium tartarophylax]VVM08108.1 hypothetical protein MAMT_02110 [Methylacidimicrobium tartarophylax]
MLEFRPIDHQNPERVRVHVFVAALAFLLDRLLEKKLKAAHLLFCTEQAWAALRTIHVVEFSLGKAKRRRVTAGNHQARQILSAFRIAAWEPWATCETRSDPCSAKFKFPVLRSHDLRRRHQP